MYLRSGLLVTGVFLAIAGGGVAPAQSQVFVATSGNNTVSSFNATTGAPIGTPLLTGANGVGSPSAMAVSGSNLFVANYGLGTVSEYTTSGAVINTSLIAGLNGPLGIAVSSSDIYIVNSNSVSEYTLSGSLVNPNLITGPTFNSPGAGYNGQGLTVSGQNLFVNTYNAASGWTVSEYTTSGALVNGSFITGITNPGSIAFAGANMFVVTNVGAGVVGKYSLSGATVNASFLSGTWGNNAFVDVIGIAGSGSNLFVADSYSNTIREYTASGALINSFSAGTGIGALAVASVPEPSSFALMAGGLAGVFLFAGWQRRPKAIA